MRRGYAVATAMAALVALTGCGGGEYDANNEREARAQCEGFAEKRLKSPSTAEFDLVATESAPGTWLVTGTVDSQNGFGAMVRSDVSCEIRISGETAYLEDLTVT